MGLIKSTNAPAALSPFSMRDVEAHARAMISKAREESEKILTIAAEEAAAARQEGYEAGFKAGMEDGKKKGGDEGRASGKQAALVEHRAALETLIKSLNATVATLDSAKDELESAASTEVLLLAIAIARKVTHRLGQSDPTIVTDTVKDAMRLVVAQTDVRIALHPSQKSLLSEAMSELKQKWPNVKHFELIDDPAIQPGGCRIFTTGGEIDAALDTQIERIASDLLPTQQEGA